MTLDEIEQTVNELQVDVYESSGVEYFNVSLITNGYSQIVEFCGIRLWDSESDERLYGDEDDEREPIGTHLRRRLREELNKLRSIEV